MELQKILAFTIGILILFATAVFAQNETQTTGQTEDVFLVSFLKGIVNFIGQVINGFFSLFNAFNLTKRQAEFIFYGLMCFVIAWQSRFFIELLGEMANFIASSFALIFIGGGIILIAASVLKLIV